MEWDPIEHPLKWAGRYPYTQLGKSLFRELEIGIEEIFGGEGSAIVEAAKQEVISLIDKEVPPPETNEYISLAKFYVAAMITMALGNSFLISRFVEREASRSARYLSKADVDEITFLSKDLGLNVAYEDGRFKIHFIDFLRYVGGLSHIHWKLYYFPLYRGYVYLEKRWLIRILKEAIKESIEEIVYGIEAIPEEVAKIADEIRIKYGDSLPKKREYADRVGRVAPEHFPPCMKHLYMNIGKGLPHPGRFTIVAFLSSLGYTVEEILDLFRVTPDFNEKITRYQIEHILGLRGGKTRYSTPSCRKIKSFGFCFPDQICKKYRVKHPFQYLKGVMKKDAGE